VTRAGLSAALDMSARGTQRRQSVPPIFGPLSGHFGVRWVIDELCDRLQAGNESYPSVALILIWQATVHAKAHCGAISLKRNGNLTGVALVVLMFTRAKPPKTQWLGSGSP
jgi:hypothetical protein